MQTNEGKTELKKQQETEVLAFLFFRFAPPQSLFSTEEKNVNILFLSEFSR